MKDGFIKVAAITPKITVADPIANTEEILRRIDEAMTRQAKLLVFPELCLTGYTCQDLFYQRTLLEQAKEALVKVVEYTKNKDAIVYIGLPLEVQGKLYNVAAVICRGEILGFIPKRFLPNYNEFYEVRQFTPGPVEVMDIIFDGKVIPFGSQLLIEVPEVNGLIIGCEICEDLWTPNPPSTNHCLAGATLVVNLSASNELVGKDSYRRQLVSSTSARLITGYVYSSAGDGESTQDLVFGGHNLIAENGSVLCESGRFSPDAVYAEIDIEKLVNDRKRMNTFVNDLRSDYEVVTAHLQKETTALTRTYGKTPFVPADKRERDKRCNDILSIQAHGLKKRLEHTGCKTAVVGISGGLDSTLALLVIARAFDLLGMDHTGIICVTMPGFGTTDRTYENACLLTKTLGATLREISIRESVMQHFADISHNPNKHDVTYENGQARERTQILMDIANQSGGLVIGTGDMSELALGWATYNGDHMSMYGVNAGVPKTLVRHLVRFYADTCKDEELSRVLLDVLDTPVSPELLPPVDGKISQKTEDLVGPYTLHDFFLYYMLRMNFSPSKIYRLAVQTFEEEYDAEIILKWLKIFYRRFFAQHFKRSCLPDGPKVGSVAVSPRGDLRMPTDAAARIWSEELEKLS